MENLIKLKKVSVSETVSLYSVFGLNIFTANQSRPREFGKDADIPFLLFLEHFTGCCETLVLMGMPAVENWINDIEYETGQKIPTAGLLGKKTLYHSVPLSFYDGKFSGYPQSILFRNTGYEMLSELVRIPMGWDAVAFLLYKKGKISLKFICDRLNRYKYKNERELISFILQDAEYLIISQSDCQYLEICTRKDDVENDIKAACEQAEDYIRSSKWYSVNKDMLVWDELEMCFLKKAGCV